MSYAFPLCSYHLLLSSAFKTVRYSNIVYFHLLCNTVLLLSKSVICIFRGHTPSDELHAYVSCFTILWHTRQWYVVEVRVRKFSRVSVYLRVYKKGNEIPTDWVTLPLIQLYITTLEVNRLQASVFNLSQLFLGLGYFLFVMHNVINATFNLQKFSVMPMKTGVLFMHIFKFKLTWLIFSRLKLTRVLIKPIIKSACVNVKHTSFSWNDFNYFLI